MPKKELFSEQATSYAVCQYSEAALAEAAARQGKFPENRASNYSRAGSSTEEATDATHPGNTMATNHLSEFVRNLHRAALQRDGAGLTDGQLLASFIEDRDEVALAALVRRHSTMVWGVCRRVLCNHHDAEDAFQATFLVLVRKAATIMERERVGNWLYGVAYQTALKARATAARRRVRERLVTAMPEPAAAEQATWNDLRPLLDQELSRLPEKYRIPIVLCELAGKTRKEAAQQLGVPEGTLAGQLARGRAMLAKRLTRRGLALTSASLAMLLTQHAASAHAPTAVVASTIKAATLFAAGTAPLGGASAQALALMKGVSQTMFLSKLKFVAAAVLSVALVGGVGGLAYHGRAVGASARDDKKADKPKDDKDAILGTWKVVAFEQDGKDAFDTPEGKKIKEATATITADKLVFKSEQDVSEFTYQLDPAAEPRAIDLLDTTTGRMGEGVYSLEGNTLKICTPIERGRPTEVAAKEGNNSRLIVLKREAKDK
jgi:RNA polymerase sigma factor (sigma-70 family)